MTKNVTKEISETAAPDKQAQHMHHGSLYLLLKLYITTEMMINRI